MAIIDSLRKLVAREYGVDVKLVTPETLLDETMGGKSAGVDLYEFYYDVEQKYGLAIGYDELTVKQLADLIEEHRKATKWWKRRL
jgi:acyl carrier protein